MNDARIRAPQPPGRRGALDWIGIGLAGLCAVHCAATLVLILGLGVGSHFLLAHEIHEIGLAFALVVAALAIGVGFVRHGKLKPLVIAAIGLGFMGTALALGHGAHEAVLTIIGVAVISLGHLLNIREAQRCAL